MGTGTESKEVFDIGVLNQSKSVISRVDYLIKHKQFDNFLQDINLKHYKYYIDYQIQHAVVGAYDPLNKKPIGINEYSLDDGNLRYAYAQWSMTIQLLKHFKVDLKTVDLWKHLPSFHYKEVKNFIIKANGEENTHVSKQSDPSSFTMLRHEPWSLISKDSSYYNSIIQGKGKIGGGWWVLHENWVEFINNRLPLPKTIIVYKDNVLKVSDEMVYQDELKSISFEERQKYRTTKYI